MSRLFLCLFALLAASLHAGAQTKYLQAGDPVPNTAVRTLLGEEVSLRSVLAAKPTVLIFYRGGWCPYCQRHLAAVAEAEPEILAAGFQVVAICADQPSKLRAKPSLEKVSYALYSDSRMQTIPAFGIAFQVPDELVAKYKDSYHLDLEADSGATHHLLPHPAVFIVDARGIIRFAHVNPDYSVRLTPAEILAALKTIVPASTGH